MKCIENTKTNEINRVSNEEAEQLMHLGGYKYVNKQRWKDAGKPRNSVHGELNRLKQQESVLH